MWVGAKNVNLGLNTYIESLCTLRHLPSFRSQVLNNLQKLQPQLIRHNSVAPNMIPLKYAQFFISAFHIYFKNSAMSLQMGQYYLYGTGSMKNLLKYPYKPLAWWDTKYVLGNVYLKPWLLFLTLNSWTVPSLAVAFIRQPSAVIQISFCLLQKA